MGGSTLFRRVRWLWSRAVALAIALLIAVTTLAVMPAAPAMADGARLGNSGALMNAAAAAGGDSSGPTKGSQGGDYSTGYPFEVPAAREGRTPQVGLSYSSSGSVNGGVAAGWGLAGSQAITVDAAAGTVREQWPGGGSAANPRNFVSPEGHPLVADPSLPVSIPGAVGYRAVGDNLSARFEYHGGTSLPWWWTVDHADGMTSYFGLKDQTPYSYAPLVRVAEANGLGDPAELKYTYATVGRTSAAPSDGQPREFLLTTIDYEAQGTDESYARVEFHYADPAFCGSPSTMSPTGARLDYRFGFARLSGTRKLTKVETKTRSVEGTGFDVRSEYTLSYNAATEACDGEMAVERGAPYRELTSVQRKAFRPQVEGQNGPAETVMPATKFTYGKAASYMKDAHYGAAVTVDHLRLPESVDTNQFLDSGADGDLVYAPGSPSHACGAPFCPMPVTPPTDNTAVNQVNSADWRLAQGQSTGESVSRMLLDVDGDGTIDLIERRGGPVKLATADPGTGGCQVDVHLNLNGSFVKQDGSEPEASRFPTFSLRRMMADVPVRAGTPDDGTGELLCAGLNRSFSPDASGGWMGDPSAPCSDHFGSTWKSMQQVRHGFMDYNRDGKPDLLAQPVTSLHCPYASTQGIPAPQSSNSDQHWVDEYESGAAVARPLPGSTSCDSVPCRVSKRQRYLYVYLNTGSGFSTTPTRVEAPALPTNDFGLTRDALHLPQDGVLGPYSDPIGDFQAPNTFADLNGDGVPDRVHRSFLEPDDPQWSSSHYESWVSFGSGTSGSWPTVLEMPEGTNLTPARQTVDRHHPAGESSDRYTSVLTGGAVMDVNGDGLSDLVQEVRIPAAPGQPPSVTVGTKVRFNTGFGFGTAADDGEVMFSEGVGDTNYLDSFRVHQLSAENWQQYRPTGERSGRTRAQDFDGDGMVDVLFYDREANRAQLYAGGGRQWVSTHPADPAVAQHLAGVVEGLGTNYGGTVQELYDRADYRYAMTHQALDLNGDGLLDLLSDPEADGKDVQVRYARRSVGSGDSDAPARLLRTISNGAGGKTTVDYKRDVQAGKWVVAGTIANPGHGQPEISSSYSYLRPAYVAGPYGRNVFRGFGEVHARTDTASGQADDLTLVTKYNYDLDPAGVLSLSATVMGQLVNAAGIAVDQPGVMAVHDSDYHVRELDNSLRIRGGRANYPMRTVLPARTTRSTCTGTEGQALDACRTSAPRVTEETTWDREFVNGAYVMELPRESEVSFVNSQGRAETRRTAATFNLAWNAGSFRLAPAITVSSAVVDGVETVLGEVRYTYQTVDFSRVQTVTVDDAKPGIPDRITRFGYYHGGAKHGLLRKVWAPEQVRWYNVDSDSAPGYSEIDYDSNGVHVTKVTNPLGHTTETVVDPATGRALDVLGPNYACPDGADGGTALDPPSACSFAQAKAANLTERGHVDVDGLSRITRTVTYRIGDVNQSSGVEVHRATYNDRAFEHDPSGNTRNSVVTENRVGRAPDGGLQFSSTRVEVDGLGRPLTSSTVQDDQTVRFVSIRYDNLGLPAEITVPAGDAGPDCTANCTLTMVNSYDPLRRIVSNGEKLTSGSVRPWRTYDYDGLTTTTTQVVAHETDETPDLSPEKRTTLTTDALGQLSTVAEKTGIGQPDAVTHYAHDALGNTASVTDADGVITYLTHDYSGNRRSVTRPGGGQGRTWQYDYDHNNQLSAITEPVPQGRIAADFTHRKEYDDLGRLTKLIPAPRDLEQSEKDEFKHGPTVISYDHAHPSIDPSNPLAGFTIGRVTSVTSPTATTITRYNEQGLPVTSSQQLEAVGGQTDLPGISDVLHATMALDSAGLPENIHYRAHATNGQQTFLGPTVRTGFARDGAPNQTQVELGAGTMAISLDRNRAGLTVARHANAGPNSASAFAEVENRYGRDQYGRLTSLQTVTFDDDRNELQRYKQTLEYYDNGLIGKTIEQLGDTNQPRVPIEYGYDNRHMITTASQGTDPDTGTGGVGYYASLIYRPSGRLDHSSIITPYNDAVRPITQRNVAHRYGDGGDPLRLDTLHVDDGTPTGMDLAAYDYDEAGNTTHRTVTQPDGTLTEYTQRWDGPSSLRKVSRPSGESETYYYHGGERVAAVHTNADGTTAQVRRYFGAQEVVYTPGQQPDYRQSITLDGEIVGRVDGNRDTGTFEHYTTTPQGHQVLALAAEDASTRRVASFGPFGEKLQELTAQGTTPTSGKYPQEFNGKDYDQVSDLLYYGARYYDPYSLQWSSADPLYLANPDLAGVDPARANLYNFSGNDPVNRVDPNGLDSCGGGQFCKDAHGVVDLGALYVYAEAPVTISSDPTEEAIDGGAEEVVEAGPGTAKTIDPPILEAGPPSAPSSGGAGPAGTGGPAVADGGTTGGGVTTENDDGGGQGLVAAAIGVAAAVGWGIYELNQVVPWPTVIDGVELVSNMLPGDGAPAGGAPGDPGSRSGGPGDSDPGDPGTGGEAIVTWNGKHAFIAVKADRGKAVLVTDLVLNEDGSHMTVVRFWEGRISSNAVHISFRLPNAVNAQAYQVSSYLMGTQGMYERGYNDCITYVSMVLANGGLRVPVAGVGLGGGFEGSRLETYSKHRGTIVDYHIPK